MKPAAKPFVLFPEDINSSTWRRLKAHVEQRLALYREMNDKEQSESQTAMQRGRIAMLKEILALDKAK